jgi:riboflavin biosynthesis pyrimidine reductase
VPSPASPSEVERELTALYGSAQLPTHGVVHSVHAVRAPDGALHALRIDAQAPHSETDWFVLSLCRARADAVLTSAENLRREPALAHRLTGPWAGALSAYRAQVLQKNAPLTCAILTRSGDLPEPHPVWSDGTRKLLLTEAARADALERRFGAVAEVVVLSEPSAASACDYLTAQGHALISVEAGPSTAGRLYRAPARITELWLTRWQSAPAAAALAGALPPDPELFAGMRLIGGAARVEQGQRFRFEQWRRETS